MPVQSPPFPAAHPPHARRFAALVTRHPLLPLHATRSLLTICLQTVKYNMKKRAGRGFTLEELKVRTC